MIYDDLRLDDIPGWLNKEEAEWLYQQASRHHRVLEIGCFFGRSTCAMLASRHPEIIVCDTLDARGTSRSNEFKNSEGSMLSGLFAHIRERCLRIPIVVIGDSVNMRLFRPAQFDFIFIDGSHDAQSVRNDIETAKRVATHGALIAIHDYGDKDRPELSLEFDQAFPVHFNGAGSIEWAALK